MEKATVMEVVVNEQKARPAGEEETELIRAEILTTSEPLLRMVSMVLNVAALLVMIKNRHKAANPFVSVAYSDFTGFKFLVYANAVSAGYSILAALRALHCGTKCHSWVFFLLDQVFTYLTLAAGTICTQVVYMAYNGVAKMSWSEGCSGFGTFCTKTAAAVAITFSAGICYILLSLISSYRLFSAFEAPQRPLVLHLQPVSMQPPHLSSNEDEIPTRLKQTKRVCTLHV